MIGAFRFAVVAFIAMLLSLNVVHADDTVLFEKAMENKAFDLALSMTIRLAVCDLTKEEHVATQEWREAGLEVAAEQMKQRPADVRRHAARIASSAASRLVADGNSKATCAAHRAWLMQ